MARNLALDVANCKGMPQFSDLADQSTYANAAAMMIMSEAAIRTCLLSRNGIDTRPEERPDTFAPGEYPIAV